MLIAKTRLEDTNKGGSLRLRKERIPPSKYAPRNDRHETGGETPALTQVGGEPRRRLGMPLGVKKGDSRGIIMRGRMGCGRRTSRRWTPEERDPNAGPEQRRDIMDRVIKVLWEDFCEAEDPETRCKISNALCVAVTAANGCDRTLAIVTGKISPLQQAIEELLAEEDPDDYQHPRADHSKR